MMEVLPQAESGLGVRTHTLTKCANASGTRPRMREGQETGRARLQSCHQASRIVIPRDFSPEESASHVPEIVREPKCFGRIHAPASCPHRHRPEQRPSVEYRRSRLKASRVPHSNFARFAKLG